MNARGPDDLVPIDVACRMLGLRSSALRYYEELGLVPSRARAKGKRWYGRAELRRLALVKIAQRVGIPLRTVRAILDEPDDEWRATVRGRLADLADLIEKATAARMFLEHTLDCPTRSPARDCPSMVGALDLLVDGGDVEELGRRWAPERFEQRAGSIDPA